MKCQTFKTALFGGMFCQTVSQINIFVFLYKRKHIPSSAAAIKYVEIKVTSAVHRTVCKVNRSIGSDVEVVKKL